MNLKRFSKLNWKRIGIFLGIYIILISFVMTVGITKKNCGFLMQRGLPFPYFIAEGGACEKNGVVEMMEYRANFYFIYFILDGFIWGFISYLFSYILVGIYEKMKK